MNENLTEIVVTQDKSSSMEPFADDAYKLLNDMAFDIAGNAEGFFCAHEAMGAAISNLRRYKSVLTKEGEDFRRKIKKPKRKKQQIS